MSEADLAESFWSAQEMGVNALMLYLTVISGHLFVAIWPEETLRSARAGSFRRSSLFSPGMHSGASSSTDGQGINSAFFSSLMILVA